MGASARTRMAATTAILLMMAVVAWLALPAVATHVDPVFSAGNENCSAASGLSQILRIEDNAVATGTYPLDVGVGSISVVIGADGTTVGWSRASGTFLVGAVFVKGGPGGNLYDYRPAGATSDTGLVAPANPGGNQSQISHISFCVTIGTTTTSTSTTTSTTSSTTTTTGSTTTTTGSTTTTTGSTTTTSSTPSGGISIGTVSGTIVITKAAPGATTADRFGFTSNHAGSFELGNGESKTTSGLAAGTYIVNESGTEGWGLAELTCDDPSGGTTVVGETATISLAAGETVTCVFTNVAILGIQVSTTTAVAPTTTVAVSAGTLPFTGLETEEWALAGLLVALAGGLLVVAARRRSDGNSDGTDVRWIVR